MRSWAQFGKIKRKHEGSDGNQDGASSSCRAARTSPTFPSTNEGDYRTAVAILFALISYGSLYPLTWNFDQPQDFIYFGPVGIIDVVENILLILPLGWLLGWHCDGYRRRWLHFWKWFIVVMVVASVLQWMQKYLPRTPAASDILFNMAGYVLGWWAGRLSARTLNSIVNRHQGLRNADRFALVMVAIWVVAELFPLIPSLDVSTVINNIKSLWQQDLWQPRRILEHMGMTLIGLDALASLLRSATVDRFVKPLAVLATLAILVGKFLMLGQSPGLAVPVGIVGGALLWWCIDRLPEETELLTLLVIFTTTYLVYALAPYELQEFPTSMQWMPFASALQSSIEAVLTSVAFEALCFGAIIWSSVRMGGLPTGITLSVAVLALGCEWVQRYLPGRTAEISSVLTALLMGWLVAVLGQSRRYKNLSIAGAELAARRPE